MDFMKGIPKHLVTYCQYSDTRMKPTHIFTNHPNPRFKHCKNGDPCHEAAPRGSRTGTQALKGSKERAVIPPALCDYIVEICEEYYEEPRCCSECGEQMKSGYYVSGDYYCSDECLYKNITKERYLELYEDDEAYYTDWL